jgi:hypothetical protein
MTVTRIREHSTSAPTVWRRGAIGEQALLEARRRVQRPRLGVPRRARDVELGWAETVAALAALEGAAVAVRVVEPGPPRTVVAVLRGTLAAVRHGRAPTLFWPVRCQGARQELEEPGIALRRDKFGGAVSRAGGHVLVISQGPLVLNVRRA